MSPKTPPPPLSSSLPAKPHQWIVYQLNDGRIRAALIQKPDSLKYFKARKDIVSSTLITAFNHSEAWRKGKDIL